MRGYRGLTAGVLAGACALGAAACGGDERQDADEPEGTFRVEVVRASFPARQSIADATRLEIEVRNADDERAPNVAVTVGTQAGTGPGGGGVSNQAFSYSLRRNDVADRTRPAWILDQGPRGAETAYTNTWALGPLEPGQTRRFVWRLTAVRPGRFTVGYSVSPGLTGKAKPAGDAKGSFQVEISGEPPDARVDADGDVVREPAAALAD